MKELLIISNIIFNKTGIKFNDERINFLSHQIEKRMKELKLNSYEEYLNYLIIYDKNNDEIVSLVDSITVNETFFFRHPSHFSALEKDVIPKLCCENANSNNPSKVLRIWSMACANGCETYSIAILVNELNEYIKKSGYEKIEIFGTDIDTDVIKEAEKGVYSNRSVKAAMPEKYLKKYFTEKGNGYELNEEVKRMVAFKQLNLTKDIFPKEIDIIFCRNVLYYFNYDNQIKVIKKIYHSLKERGYLFLGASEYYSLNEYFKTYYLDEIQYYKKWSTGPEGEAINNAENEKNLYNLEPSIKIDKSENIIRFKGKFGNNYDSEKFKHDLLFEYCLMDKQKYKNTRIFNNIAYYTLYFDFKEIEFISNDMICELKEIIMFLKSKGIIISIITGDNQNIINWLANAKFKEFCNIEKEIERAQSPVNINIENKKNNIIKENLNIKIQKDDKNNYELNRTKIIENKMNKKIFNITNCSEKELKELKDSIVDSLRFNKKIIINLKNACNLTDDFFDLIRKSRKAADNNDLILISEENFEEYAQN